MNSPQPQSVSAKINEKWQLAVLLIAGIYLLLCAVHYIRQRPLWLDENSVFQSVEKLPPGEYFTKPNLAAQIFPKLYLLTIQTVSRPFDFHLLSLRFLPFLCMVTAFFIWLRIGREELADDRDYFVFVLCWVASTQLVYYSAELKQYSMDVLAGAAFLLFLRRQNILLQENPRLTLAILAGLPLFGLFSYPAFLFFIFPLYNLLRTAEGRVWRWRCLVVYLLSAGLAAAFVYFFDIRVTGANTHTQGFMDYSVSFQSVGEFFKTFWEGTVNLFVRWFAERPRVIKRIATFFMAFGLMYMFYGFFRDLKKHRFALDSIDGVALVLYAQLFLLGSLGKYPFTVPRTSLFFCPIVLVMTIRGIRAVGQWHAGVGRVIYGAYILFLLAVAFGVVRYVLTQELGIAPKVW